MCYVDGCNRDVWAAGLCSRHYERKRKTGTTDDGPRARLSLTERFWKYVDKRGPDDCWNWTAKSRIAGYGVIGLGGRNAGKMLAHRLSWVIHNGDIPDSGDYHGTVVMHTCDNRLCVNPSHLRLGSQSENVRDMDRKGRRTTVTRSGTDHHNAKLDDDAVRFIRDSDLPQRKLAAMFGVSRHPIARIKRGDGWKHVE